MTTQTAAPTTRTAPRERTAADVLLAAARYERLMRVLPPDAQFPWAWNDEPGRTRDQVIAALRAAAR